MIDFSSPLLLSLSLGLILLASFALSPRRVGDGGFYRGTDTGGQAPGLWTLVFSQVTTWIFARSLMNAAILGYFYGVAGTLAYTAYYGSFLTGMVIVDRIRAGGGGSVQDWLVARFGRAGTACYNLVIALRLMSELFANLLVVGTIFQAAYGGSVLAGQVAIVLVALVGLGYAMLGGLRAALRTDVFQMVFFLLVFAVALVALLTSDGFSLGAALTAPGVSGPQPGWILLGVALLQVISYPAHDPVMMDRGFLADRSVTRRSFLLAFLISSLCIFAFGLFGIEAGLRAVEGDTMQTVWARMFGPGILFCLNLSLLVSALSTLDSALASAARLSTVELGLGAPVARSGRIAMALFMLGGLLFLLAGTDDLFAAVAVSGTASMFLVPVLAVGLLAGRAIPLWSFLLAFAAAMAGAVAYFFQASDLVQALFGSGHKYERLLWICLSVLIVGFAAVFAGAATRRRVAEPIGH
ncbi:SLC5/6 family protein [Oceanomicrobium pacificus]|uniref:Sodium:proline symporter n=1 Tax=Oceanomicrobium pacificus TaxID=2692916 RepID=A0A6B0U3V7_9RHOB|nr:sodium:proline symporter [Oceanomicrobium pacificus]MXU65621.1 sodium:proline symporter [Oceanomicrobium pacificus]